MPAWFFYNDISITDLNVANWYRSIRVVSVCNPVWVVFELCMYLLITILYSVYISAILWKEVPYLILTVQSDTSDKLLTFFLAFVLFILALFWLCFGCYIESGTQKIKFYYNIILSIIHGISFDKVNRTKVTEDASI